MGIIRFILFIFLIWILWRFFKRMKYQNDLQKQQDLEKQQDKNNIASEKSQHGVMVRCDYCGLYLPKEEAYSTDHADYCCEKHFLLNG